MNVKVENATVVLLSTLGSLNIRADVMFNAEGWV